MIYITEGRYYISTGLNYYTQLLNLYITTQSPVINCIHFSLHPTTIQIDDTFLPYCHVGQLNCLHKIFLLKIDNFRLDLQTKSY
jgi:hypothetical protein